VIARKTGGTGIHQKRGYFRAKPITTAICSMMKPIEPPRTAQGSTSHSIQLPRARSCLTSHQRSAIENGRSTDQRTTSMTIPTIIPEPIGPSPVARASGGILRTRTTSAASVTTIESTTTIRTKRS
jgi:hypothetical protein